MKNPLLPALLLLVGAALSLAAPGKAIAYDSPNFDVDVFSRDGIFLPGDQKTSLLEALAAIASNFSTSNRVDDDLREKALGLALRIDPLHYHSRLAHRALAAGEAPKATTYFDSLSVVSETLWNLASQLSKAPFEPEQRRLAPFLMELSLLTHPEPNDERLATFAASFTGKDLPWGKFITLQPGDNKSTGRARYLHQEGLALLAKREKRGNKTALAAAGPGPGSTDTMPDKPADVAPDPGRPGPMEPVIATLNAVRQIEAVESRSAAGVVKLTLRSPLGRTEREMLESQVGSGTAAIPLIASRESLPLTGLEIPAPLAASRNWSWPAAAIGELAFSTAAEPPGPARLTRTGMLLPGVVLIDSVLRKVPVNDQMILSGRIDPVSYEASLPDDAVPTIEAAAAGMRGKYLLLPATATDPLITYLVKSGQLGILFTNELISYQSLDEAIAYMTTPTPATLSNASVVFREIEAVSDRMPLTDLARNAKVMERLESILATTPGHLSARAMLEFGRRPESTEMRLSLSAGRVNAIVLPLFEFDSPVVDLNALASKIDPAKLELSRLRTEIPVEVRDFHSAGENFLEACELYLDLTNKGTALALQRMREAKEKRAAFQALGQSLGLTYSDAEDE
jgi:hypothetical protein